MDRSVTLTSRRIIVGRKFEGSRLAEEILASAYERLIPLVGRQAILSRHLQSGRIAQRPFPTRRAS